MIRAALVLVMLCAMLSPSAAQTFRKESLRIPFAVAGPRGLEALLVRPADDRRYPLALISHGTPRDQEMMKSLSPGRYYSQAIEFARRGFVVLIVMRRGYGDSDGANVESSGACGRRDFLHAARTSAEDLRAAVAAMRARADVSTESMIAIGQSAGGLASIAFAAQQPQGLAAIINFAGGRGSRAELDVCDRDRLVAAFGELGRTARVPMLWVYSQNDLYFWPELAQRFHTAFEASGGRAKFVAAPPFGRDGHSLFSTRGTSEWLPIVDAFLNEQKLGLRVPLPPPTTDAMLPPPQSRENGRVAFTQFLLAATTRLSRCRRPEIASAGAAACEANARRAWRRWRLASRPVRPAASMRSTTNSRAIECGSGLPLRNDHFQPVELGRHLDLARQARGRAHVEGEIEHVLFHWRGSAGLLLPSVIHIDVAGRARAGAAALGEDARNSVADRSLHDRRAGFRLNGLSRALVIDEVDFDHDFGFRAVGRGLGKSSITVPDRDG
jgi:dienelactone hydrolase